MKMVALIPARGGSKRIPRKNIKPLAGKPLMAYTIEAARSSGVFTDIVCSTDDIETGHVAAIRGAQFLFRPEELAQDDSPDILWVSEALREFQAADAFAILRPTSPFRTAETIRRAYSQFSNVKCDSIRAVQPVKEHPMKMWKLASSGFLAPLFTPPDVTTTPYHSRPTQTLQTIYVQNASLEMAWTRVIHETNTISGWGVKPFFTEGHEGFDINTPEDWDQAERIAHTIYESAASSTPQPSL